MVRRCWRWKGVPFAFVVLLGGVFSLPVSQGTVTQTGEPSHFQVDDKAAEIEVNANPAGVKVNAKPASLQVVAKPGTPAIPVFHPSIQLAPHYAQPPIIRREPALSYLGPRPWPFAAFGGFDSGLRRNKLTKPETPNRRLPITQKREFVIPRIPGRGNVNTKRSKISRISLDSGLRRDKLTKPETPNRRLPVTLKREFIIPRIPGRGNVNTKRSKIPSIPHGVAVENGALKRRNYKSRIPSPAKKPHKSSKTHKRQFIQGAPQGYQSQLGGLGGYGQGLSGLGGYGQGLAGLGGYGQGVASLGGYNQGQGVAGLGGYGLVPQIGALNQLSTLASKSGLLQRAPLTRTISRGYSGRPSGSTLGGLAGYGVSPYSTLAALGSSIGLSRINAYGQPTTTNPLSFTQPSGTSPYGDLSAYGAPSSAGMSTYGGDQGSLSSLFGGIGGQGLGGLAASPASMASSRGYTRSILGNPFSSLDSLHSSPSSSLNPSGLPSSSSLYSRLLGLKPLVYDPRFLGYEKSSLQLPLAPMYAAQPALSSLGGLQAAVTQQYRRPLSPYLSPILRKSQVPGSKGRKAKTSPAAKKSTASHKGVAKAKKRAKRQLLYPGDVDDGSLDLNALQNDLVNQYKRELILGSRALQPAAASPLSGQQSLPQSLQLQGLDQSFAATQQSANPLLQRLNLDALNANYISPIDNINTRMMTSSQLPQLPMTSQLVQSRLPMAQSQLMTSPMMSSRLPPLTSELPLTSSPLARRMFGQRDSFDNERDFNPMMYGEGYRSPMEYERPHFRRKFVRRHPLFRRRLHRMHRPRDYDEDEDDDDGDDEDDRELHRGDPYGRERVSVEGSYSEKVVPGNRGETLVDSDGLGFGPITVEAKTAEGVQKSLGHDSRSRIVKPHNTERRMRDRHTIPRAHA